MGQRLLKRAALLAKIEGTYGTDPVPAGATDAMYAYDVKITPLEAARADRNPVRPFFGQDKPVFGGSPVKIEFMIPIAGGGAAGTAPGYDAVMRACGRSKTVNVGVSVVYAPISSGFESCTLYYTLDGVLHKAIGARGNAAVEFTHNGIPMYKVSLTSMYAAPIDGAVPALTFGATWPAPVLQDRVNTTFSLHGISARLVKFSYDQGYQVSWKNYVNNTEEVRFTDRPKVTGSVTIEADSIATKDWFATAKAGTSGAIQVVHGTVAGNKWQHDSATAIVTNPKYGDDDGTVTLEMGIEMLPTSAGNNEFSETVL